MLEKLCSQQYCKTDFIFVDISDNIREGSGVSAEDELLNKHTTSTKQHLAHDQHIHAATTNNKYF